MAENKQPTIIKKYANRRLYHTGTSTYVTLDDLALMIQKGDDFQVQDAKTGEDITRSVLTQIIFEQENKDGQSNLLPIAFLRQLIRFYGDSLQALVPSYLESSMQHFSAEQQRFRDEITRALGAETAFKAVQQQAKVNMAMYQEAMKLFMPFMASRNPLAKTEETPTSSEQKSDIDQLKNQLADMQRKIDELSKRS